jgi:hypothetical protein
MKNRGNEHRCKTSNIVQQQKRFAETRERTPLQDVKHRAAAEEVCRDEVPKKRTPLHDIKHRAAAMVAGEVCRDACPTLTHRTDDTEVEVQQGAEWDFVTLSPKSNVRCSTLGDVVEMLACRDVCPTLHIGQMIWRWGFRCEKPKSVCPTLHIGQAGVQTREAEFQEASADVSQSPVQGDRVSRLIIITFSRAV